MSIAKLQLFDKASISVYGTIVLMGSPEAAKNERGAEGEARRRRAYCSEDRSETSTARKPGGGDAERTSRSVSRRTQPVDNARRSLSTVFREHPDSEPDEPGEVSQRSPRVNK